MVDQWTRWKKFPEPRRGEHLEAPLGPGVYELRRMTSGELLDFGYSPNVAATLARHIVPTFWERLRRRGLPEVRDIEYRTMAAVSAQRARDHAASIARRREIYWSRLSPGA